MALTLSTKLRRVLERLRTDLRDVIEENPYGIFYRNADLAVDPDEIDQLIVNETGLPLDDPRRIEFLCWRAVDGAARNGHTGIKTRAVLDFVIGRAGHCERAFVIEALSRVVSSGALVPFRRDKESWLHLANLASDEETTAAFIAGRVGAPSNT